MSKRKTGKGPRAQRVSENDSYHAPVSLVQKERGKVDKICPFDASAFLGLLDDDDSDKIADDDEDNKKPHSQKANWDSYYISSYPVPQEQAKMVQSCPFSAAFLGFPDDACGPINTVFDFDDDGDMATEKASSTSALSTPMVVLQDAEEDIPFQKPDKMAQQLFSFFTFGGKNGIADRHEAPLWKHGSPATPCKVSRLAETAGPWEHVALLTIIICSDSTAFKRSERRKRIKKRSKKSRKSSRNSPEKIVIPRTHVFLGKDTSEGNPKKIHGLSIARKEILEALGPEGLRSRDFTELMAAAVDVPALPGTTNINSDTYETELLVDSLLLALLTNGKESGKGVHLDTNWKRPSRHALMRVKNGEGLLKLVGGLDKAKTSAFGNMSLYIEAFMVKRNYPDDESDDYCNQGALVRLMYKTYDYYNQLLGKLRELHYKHFQRWEGSPAAALLDHHSEKLLFIRCNSVNRTAHLLRYYTYLRDAAANGFSANKVIESLWERVAEIHKEIENRVHRHQGRLAKRRGKSRTTTKNDRERACPKCDSKKLHDILQKGHTASACPLSEHATSKAHKMRTKILRVHTKDKSKDVNQIIKDVSETWDTPQEGED